MQRSRPAQVGRRSACGCRTAAVFAVLAGLATADGPARAADGWEQAGSGAVAVLPPPLSADAILGASLHCAEQRWHFFFRPVPGALPGDWHGKATILASGERFEVSTTAARDLLAVPVSAELLAAVKAGSRMKFVAGEVAAAAMFSLKRSLATIEAVAPRCSPVDMSDYETVLLSGGSSALKTATALLAEEAALFRAATGKQPVQAAARLDLEDGRQLLFTSLCGSTSYYGRSGCGLFGYAAEGTPGEWHLVYNTEGLLLHTDPRSSSGSWPNLVTLPLSGGSGPDHWEWNGVEYELLESVENAGQPAMSEGDAEE